MTKQIRLLVTLALMSVMIAACGTAPKPTSPPPYSSSLQDEQVRQLLNSAQSAPPAQAAELQLAAAERLALQGNDLDAISILESINKRRLPAELGLSIALQQAAFALDQNNPERALSALDFHQLPTDLTNDQLIRLNIARAETLDIFGNPIGASRELIAATQMINDTDLLQTMHNQIWSIISSANQANLLEAVQNRNNNYLEQGWFERASSLAGITDPQEQQEKLFDWQLLWDQHPAATLPPRDAGTSIATEMSPITLTEGAKRVALFLPLQGDLADISRTIIEGFITAMQASGMNSTEVIMLDSTEILSPEQLFHSARSQGIDFIVGPLDRHFVNQLADLPDHPIPVLALNPAEQGFNPPFQLDLSSDHEVNNLVSRAIDLNYRTAMVIRSDNRSGERFEQLIRDAFQRQGGSISASLTFKPTENNSQQIRQLLLQDPEIARTMPSQSRSGMRVNVSHQTDVIFMAAEPRDARLIRPMLLYHFAGNIPVMASSLLYEGYPSASRDNDLNGIIFVDIPWRLSSPSTTRLAIEGRRQDVDTDIGKLYALGADTYLVSQQLGLLLQQQVLTGETGRLTLGQNRRIARDLNWSHFVNGVPQPITE